MRKICIVIFLFIALSACKGESDPLIVDNLRHNVYSKGQSVLRLANIYADDMVLQRGPKRASIWGYGQAGAEVKILYENLQVSGVVQSKIFELIENT
jgi:hypothetical protein